MCSSCGFPAAAGHWTETGAVDAGGRLRARYRRSAVLKRVLAGTGLAAHDGGIIPGIQLSTASGSTMIVTDLEEFWREAERLMGRPLDPLSPDFLGGRTCG